VSGQANSEGVRGRLISGIKWTALQSVFVAASNFATAVMVARLLGVDSFGAFSIIRITGFSLATMAGAGLGITATKYIAEMRAQGNARLGKIIGLCSIVAICTSIGFAGALWLFADEIATTLLKAPQIAGQLSIAAVYIFFVTLNGYQVGALVGFEAFAILAKLNLLQAFLSLILTYLLTVEWGLTGAVVSLGVAAFTNWVFHQLVIRREMNNHDMEIQYSQSWQEKRVLIDFTFPAAISSIIGVLTVWGCNAYLVRQPDGLIQVGIFSAVNTLRSFILFVPGLVSRVASPILCNLMGKRNQSSYVRLFWTNIATAAAASSGVAGILVFAAPYILKLFGKDFGAGGAVAMVVVVMTVIEVMANAFYSSILVHGRLWWQLRVILCWSTALGAVTYLTVGNYGALGLAYAYLVAHIVSLAMYVFITFKVNGTRMPGAPNNTPLPLPD